MNPTGEDIVSAARHYIGTPFRHAGRNEHGVDCVGLVLVVAYRLGISQYVPRPYARLVDPDELRAEVEEVCDLIPSEEKRPGDILLLRVGGVPQHLGIYAGETLIHAFNTVGRVVEAPYSGQWEDRTADVYRWKGFQNG